MAERLTKKDKPILKNQLEDNMSVNESTAIKRLWQYENIMGKYNVEDLDQLDIMLFCLSSETKFQLKQLQKLYKKYKIKNVEELDKKIGYYIDKIDLEAENDYLKKAIEKQNMISKIISKNRDTWQKACELACDVLRDINYKIYNEDRIDFENTFYQQAKKEKENNADE